MAVDQVQWCERDLLRGPYLGLCTSEAAFTKAMRRMKVKTSSPFVNPGADATAHTFERAGNLAVVVCLNGTATRTPIEVAGLLIHEAVHVWQHFRRSIGEHAPGDETEAYAIQVISQRLMEAYVKTLKER